MKTSTTKSRPSRQSRRLPVSISGVTGAAIFAMSEKLTQEEKNIKICEALGWRRIKPDMVGPLCWEKANEPHEFGFTAYWQHELPNYFNDLNACHEMEKVLDEKQELRYLAKLAAQVSIGKQHTVSWNRERTYHATATQRAEAFGLTLNIWEPAQ